MRTATQLYLFLAYYITYKQYQNKMCKLTSCSQCGSFRLCSLSTIVSDPSLLSRKDSGNADDLLPPSVIPRPSRKHMAPEILAKVMDWFKDKEIYEADTVNLAEKLSIGELKKSTIKRNCDDSGTSQLLERRLKRKLAIAV